MTAGLDEDTLRRSASHAGVPAHLVDGLLRYRFHHVRSGDFLMAVLCNDLHSALQYADPVSLHALRVLTRWIYFEFPHDSWGSVEIVGAWLSRREPATDPAVHQARG